MKCFPITSSLLLMSVAGLWSQTPVPAGVEFQVNSFTVSGQSKPTVAADSIGNFIIVWESAGSFGTDTNDLSIQAQRYDVTGIPLGGEFQVNSYTTGLQYDPAVTLADQGEFVVAWVSEGSYGSDSSLSSIQGQLFDSSGMPAGGEF